MNPFQVGPMEIGAFVLCVGVIVSIVVNVVKLRTLLAAKERQPPLDQELYREFVRKDELVQMRQQFIEQLKSLDERHQNTAGEIFSVMRKLADDIKNQSLHVESSLNRVAEGLGDLRGSLRVHIAAEKGGEG